MKQVKTKIIGILNITPDSFSDGGVYLDTAKAQEHAAKMINCGVDIIDIGAESTRPGGCAITIEEEFRRLEKILPAVYKLAKENNVLLSLDSRNYKTLDYFQNYYDIINDVTGLNDPKILEVLKNTNKQAIFMHSLTVPADKNKLIPENLDPIKYLQNWLDQKVAKFKENNIDLSRVIFDPGLGFGLRPLQNIEVIKRLPEMEFHGIRVLIGHSRKSFLKAFGEVEAVKRDPETHVISSYLMKLGVDYIRVHDVEATIRIKKLIKELY